MGIREIDEKMTSLTDEAYALIDSNGDKEQLREVKKEYVEIAKEARTLSPHDRVFLARHRKRPKVDDYIGHIFEDLFIQRGDYLGKEDKSIYGGIATFHGIPVTVIGHRKGRNINENMEYNFGMPEPEGYRKALRMMKQAEKFGRPIITFIDTPGAYPGIEAEEHGQSSAISNNLAEMSALKVPVISIVTGEGSSGGALAIGVANSVYMLENAVYSVLSPEGFASILWKDSKRSAEACELMKLTSYDLLEFGVIDGIIKEPVGGVHHDPEKVYAEIDRVLTEELTKLRKMSPSDVAKHRYEKFRNIDKLVR